jgi:transposase InsO family protein
MIIPLLQSIRDKQFQHQLPMSMFYNYLNTTRQSFFQAKIRIENQHDMMEQIGNLVRDYRKFKDRRAGSRSLYQNLNIKKVFNIGVTRFEELMAEYSMTLTPLRTKVVTTKSSMQSWNYPNLVAGLSINNINQVVAGDLTYLAIDGRRYLLFCLTDIYSARIVGYHLGRSMRAEDAKQALDRWIRLRRHKNLTGCIHHTDGGSQYFSELYLTVLNQFNIKISCADNCLENGYAEQRNGLIKHHLIPTLKDLSEDKIAHEFHKIITFYNSERKQEALGWLSPIAFEKKVQLMGTTPVKKISTFKTRKNGF